MANIIKILLLLFLAILFSCEEQGLFVKCSECTTEEPLNILLDVKIDRNQFGAKTLINVYEGDLEDNVLYGSYTAAGSNTTIGVKINKKYTLTATYYVPDDNYVVVDSATPKVRYNKDQCDDPCYFVYDKVIDLRLKGNRQ